MKQMNIMVLATLLAACTPEYDKSSATPEYDKSRATAYYNKCIADSPSAVDICYDLSIVKAQNYARTPGQKWDNNEQRLERALDLLSHEDIVRLIQRKSEEFDNADLKAQAADLRKKLEILKAEKLDDNCIVKENHTHSCGN